MTALTATLAGLVGLLVGSLVNRVAGRFPWTAQGSGQAAVPRPMLELGTAALFTLVALWLGPTWELPAFLFFAGAAVLLTVIDLQHRLLPNRIVLPSIAVGAVLLLVAALPGQEWAAFLRACLAAAFLFVVFLVMALISPSGLGWGDVKLAGLVGLYLGWLGWSAVAVGVAAAFVVQAAVALVLLAARRVGPRGELAFGPAMLVGAAVAIAWSDAVLS
jgi:leader peptidase (prepilin peptidase) / N-methyltransferase